jgi:hypothetical protein
MAAERAVRDELEDLFCADGFLDRLVQRVQQRWREARATRSRHQASLQGFREQLARVEAEIQNLVKAVAEGILLEDLAEEMRAAEARRDHLRQELAASEGAELPAALNVLPATVRRIVSDLPGMLAAGQVEPVKHALMRLVGKIEVTGEERPGRKRPGACLLLRGNLQAALHLADEKSTSDCSPGGILTLVTFAAPVRVMSLQGRPYAHRGLADERHRASALA